MSLLRAMSLAGTIPLVIYYLLKIIFRDRCSVHLEMKLLEISMFFYLCPFQECKYKGWFPYIPCLFQNHIQKKQYLSLPWHIAVDIGTDDYTLVPVWKLVLLLIWLIAVFLFVIMQLWRYFRLKRVLRETSVDINFDNNSKLKEQGKKGVSYKKNSFLKTPFTIGIWRPWVILPDMEITEDEKNMILLHETAHIKNRDLLKKMLCLGIVMLHWFNPAVWLLLYEQGAVSEQICDEAVAKALNSKEERRNYARLLLETAAREKKIPAVFANQLAGGEKRMKKRINTILNPERKTFKILSAAMILAVVLSSSTLAAYEKPFSTTKDSFENVAEGTYWILNEPTSIHNFSRSDIIFTYKETGEVINLNVYNDSSTYSECSHIYHTGTIAEHTKNSTGGCTVEEYNAKLCSKCGRQIKLELIVQMTYPKCLHYNIL